MENLLLHLSDKFRFQINQVTAIAGGDINRAFRLRTSGANLLLKVNTTEYPKLFETENVSLQRLRQTDTVKVPKVIGFGNREKLQFLLMDWIPTQKASVGKWREFGRSLARMHKLPQPNFGLENANYLGTHLQDNSPKQTWSAFYSENRILPMALLLRDQKKFVDQDVILAENFCRKLDEIYPKENPSLVHGDLWSSNFVMSGEAFLIDPAVCRAHREMDLAMTKLFGGFAADFYLGYEQEFPLEKGFENRMEASQLYPLLFHALAFGGHYVGKCLEILRAFA
ncbi:fructosamine kinase family protein [Flavobacterium sp.]|uniref:fructosamine kinase family protein n=1 Tax=Flavobacterium sp. TaxID=239 RepID=UPI001207649F|nr:fructosamine kinase family protein [Flavobacterium sp.]RZJ72894.1 MAG: fructosamine kinase [Flavobacterium sp.]